MCDWLNLFYGYDAIAVDKMDGHGLSYTACLAHLAKETKLIPYHISNIKRGLNYLAVSIGQSPSVIKVSGQTYSDAFKEG